MYYSPKIIIFVNQEPDNKDILFVEKKLTIVDKEQINREPQKGMKIQTSYDIKSVLNPSLSSRVFVFVHKQ